MCILQGRARTGCEQVGRGYVERKLAKTTTERKILEALMTEGKQLQNEARKYLQNVGYHYENP